MLALDRLTRKAPYVLLVIWALLETSTLHARTRPETEIFIYTIVGVTLGLCVIGILALGWLFFFRSIISAWIAIVSGTVLLPVVYIDRRWWLIATCVLTLVGGVLVLLLRIQKRNSVVEQTGGTAKQ